MFDKRLTSRLPDLNLPILGDRRDPRVPVNCPVRETSSPLTGRDAAAVSVSVWQNVTKICCERAYAPEERASAVPEEIFKHFS